MLMYFAVCDKSIISRWLTLRATNHCYVTKGTNLLLLQVVVVVVELQYINESADKITFMECDG